jgi:hypothetical protein
LNIKQANKKSCFAFVAAFVFSHFLHLFDLPSPHRFCLRMTRRSALPRLCVSFFLHLFLFSNASIRCQRRKGPHQKKKKKTAADDLLFFRSYSSLSVFLLRLRGKMVQLSLIEEIKDKASRLIPTAYMEIVEECTAPHLLIPTYEHVKFLCETVNRKPDAIVDVVRALRRRIADNDVAVKHLTVQLLESMIKSSSTDFHIEIASQKGLLRDLVNIACMQPTTGRAMQAKEVALLLTLNLSIWFRGHPVEECYILTTLADDVRNQLGPNCFEGIEPERNTRLRMRVGAPPPLRASARSPNARAGTAPAGRGASHRQEKRNIVDAIPIDLPTPERVSAMLDVCMTFSEYLANAAMNTETPLRQDEVVQSYLSQVRADHNYVTILLSSNLQLDRDILRTVSDSQSCVLKKVEEAASASSAHRTVPSQSQQQQQLEQRQSATIPVRAVQQQSPVRSAVDTEAQPQREFTPSRATPPRAEVATHGSGAAPTTAPPPQVPAPSVEDLFGDAAAAATAISSSNAAETSVGSSVPAPPQPLNPSMPSASPSTSTVAPVAADPAPAPAAVHVDPVPVSAESEESVKEPAQAEKEEEEKAEEAQEREQAEVQPTPAAPAAAPASIAGAPVAAEAPKAPVPAPAAAAPVAPTGASPKDDDDFDAFLDGRM